MSEIKNEIDLEPMKNYTEHVDKNPYLYDANESKKYVDIPKKTRPTFAERIEELLVQAGAERTLKILEAEGIKITPGLEEWNKSMVRSIYRRFAEEGLI